MYRLASTSSTATVAAVKAGQSTAVTAIGAQSGGFSGLTPLTDYYAHFVHTDAAGNDSAVATSAIFTTGAPGATVVGEAIVDADGNLLANTAISKVAFLRLSDMANVLTLSAQTTDASGMLPVNNGAFSVGQTYLRILSSADGSLTGCKAYNAS